MRKSSVQWRAERKGILSSGWRNVFLLFRMEVRRNKEEGEVAFVQYMECSPLRDILNKVLGRVSLRWTADDDTDHTFAKMF